MFKKATVTPDRIYENTREIPLKELRDMGFRVAFFDMDNTIVPDRAEQPGEYAFDTMQRFRDAGFRCCIVSNAKSDRSSLLAEQLGVPCISQAKKPGITGMARALSLMDAKNTETIMLGDQLLTDIIAAKRAGIFAIWMLPLGKKEIFYVRIKRPIEKILRWIARF